MKQIHIINRFTRQELPAGTFTLKAIKGYWHVFIAGDVDITDMIIFGIEG